MHQVQQKISAFTYPAAGWFGLVMIFGLPWSHAFFYIGFVGLLGCALASTAYYRTFFLACRQNTGLLALLLFAYIALGLLYTSAPLDMAMFDVKKYRKLLIIPVFMMVYRDVKWAKRLMIAYGFGVLSLMLPTLLDGTGLMRLTSLDLSQFRDGSYSETSLVYWRNHIVHGFHVSIFFVVCVLSAIRYPRTKWLCTAMATICIIDIVTLIHGRTALIAVIAISLLIVLNYISHVHLRVMVALAILMSSVALYELSGRIQERIDSIAREARAYAENSNTNTSGGNRLHYWSMSFNMFLDAPLTGNGPGKFRKNLEKPENPLHKELHRHAHNEYLTLLSQHGIIGLIIFFCLVQQIYQSAGRHRDIWLKGIVRIGLIIFLVNAVTDSSLHNESEGWTFVLLACLANMRERDTEPG
ncbi:O-antigen ligase family protein [Rhodoferax sp.]|uniref:O-antigen ligase family protein n=1 Tax=Rhodoferax sp. TaxID=50421 RepID=UPI001EB769DB|nr:O-antigen ligase family protein [Rhodoferax sp.]MBT9506888.1 O-antigen ligase family protein [Rhodoferax sp.]